MHVDRTIPSLFLAITAVLLLTPVHVESAERKSPSAGAPPSDPAVLRVYMSGNYMPLHGIKGKKRIGIEAEIAEALAAAMGKRVEYFDRERAGTTSLEAVARGRVDIALNAITPTKERAERVDFTEPVATVPLRIAIIFNRIIRSVSDLAGKKIAVPRGPLESQLADLNAKLIAYDSVKEAVESLGQTDVVIAEEPSLRGELAKHDQLYSPDLNLGASPIAVAVPKGRKAEYDAVLARIADKIALIRSQYAQYWMRFLGVSVGQKTACAITETKALACFGDQEHLLTPPAGRFVGLSMGAEHACAIRDDFTLVCWGKNDHSQATPKPGKFRRVTAGVDHTCGLMEDNSLSCWGANQHGQSDAPSGTYSTVGVGDGFSCALRSDNRVICWGKRKFDNIPPQSRSHFAVGPMGVCGIAEGNGTVCWMGDNKPPVDMNDRLTNLTIGFDIACGLDQTANRVECIGAQLGYIPDKGRFKGFSQIEAGKGMVCGLVESRGAFDVEKSTGSLECWGAFSSDPQQMKTAGGAFWHMVRARRSESPPVVALCRNKKWQKIGLLHHERGAIQLRESNYEDKNSLWYVCSGKGPQTIDLGAPCKENNLIAATIPLSEKGVKMTKKDVGGGVTLQDLAVCDSSELPGSLWLILYNYDPIKAGFTQEEINQREGQEIGTGALRDCSGLVLSWDDSPGEAKNLDIDGCLERD